MPDQPQASDPHRFLFELDRAIRDQVIEKLETSPLLPLAKNVAPHQSGVYALYFKRKLVYIGKASKGTTKSKRTLRGRLNEHVGKLGNRENLTLADMRRRFLVIVQRAKATVHYGFPGKTEGVHWSQLGLGPVT